MHVFSPLWPQPAVFGSRRGIFQRLVQVSLIGYAAAEIDLFCNALASDEESHSSLPGFDIPAANWRMTCAGVTAVR